MADYTKSLEALALPSTVAACITLPAPPRGRLARLIIKQTVGTDEGFGARLLDRRGACINAVDLNVLGGGIVSSANNGGNAQFTVDAAHNLLPGNTVYIKGTTDVNYDGIVHTVLSIESATVFTTTTAHSTVVSAGYWQTEPLDEYPILDPDMHLVHEVTVSGGGGGISKEYELLQPYTNNDNQHVTARRRATQLYLELTPSGTGNKSFNIAYTIEPSVVGD